jgi:HK97 family phage major capsid protein
LGIPVIESENCPDTWTTGLYVGLIGDLTHYYIAEVEGVEIRRLDELRALNMQVVLRASQYGDAMPISPASGEAFSRVTLG